MKRRAHRLLLPIILFGMLAPGLLMPGSAVAASPKYYEHFFYAGLNAYAYFNCTWKWSGSSVIDDVFVCNVQDLRDDGSRIAVRLSTRRSVNHPWVSQHFTVINGYGTDRVNCMTKTLFNFRTCKSWLSSISPNRQLRIQYCQFYQGECMGWTSVILRRN